VARHRQHTREFKLAALARLDTAPDVQALARELGIERTLLYRWQRHYISGGAAALRNSGRPRPVLMQPAEVVASVEERPALTASAEERGAPATAAEEAPTAADEARGGAAAALAAHDAASVARRIAELERKIGQQQLELDFFRAALRHVRASRR
jgi:transposase-like protein